MHYHGGKSRLAPKFAPILNKALDASGGVFVEPFTGGFNIIPAVVDHVTRATCNDLNMSLVLLYKGMRDGSYEPPDELSEEEWHDLRDKKDPTNPLTAFAAFGCSFAGKEWGGYARDPKAGTNYCAQAKRSLEAKSRHMDAVEFVSMDYRKIDVPDGAVVYADPPYADTTSYKVGGFDHHAFYAWCEDLARRGCRVFVSEFTIPDRPGWDVVWTHERKVTMSIDDYGTRIEYLVEVHATSEHVSAGPQWEPSGLFVEAAPGPAPSVVVVDRPSALVQEPMYVPESDWRPPNPADLPSWADARRVCVDIETHDPDLKKLGCGVRRDGRIVGIGFAIEDGPCHYLPFGHVGGDNLDRDVVLRYFRDQARLFRGDLVTAGGQYDLDYLWEEGIVFRPRFHRDIQIAEPLLDELQWNYNLEAIAGRHGLPGKDESLLRDAAEAYGVDPKADMWKLPARFVGPYGERDCRLPLALLRRQEAMLAEQDLEGIYDLESRLMPVLVRMRRRGVRVDFDKLAKVERWSLEEERKALKAVTDITGIRLDVSDTTKASALEPAFEKVGIKLPRTKTGLPSVKTEVLATIDHPIAAHVRRAKKMNKLRTTFVESVRTHAVGDRIYGTINQLRQEREDGGLGGTIARLSYSNPNLQQQPNRDPEIGPLWRSIYIPDENAEWGCLDFSQQEPRWVVHFAELSKCVGAAKAADMFRKDPRVDNHSMMAGFIDPTFVLAHYENKDHPDHKRLKTFRDTAKQIFLALCYGMGGAKLCRTLGLPTVWVERHGRSVEVAGPEGQALLRLFDERVPYVRELAIRADRRAKQQGYITTVLGRRCRFPTNEGGAYEWTHKALNRLIQGSSADQTKLAMVLADDAGIPVQLQVHDELDLSLANRDVGRRLAEIMRDCVPCNVPHRIDFEVGPSWGEIKEAA